MEQPATNPIVFIRWDNVNKNSLSSEIQTIVKVTEEELSKTQRWSCKYIQKDNTINEHKSTLSNP
jgi:hypothetical protein